MAFSTKNSGSWSFLSMVFIYFRIGDALSRNFSDVITLWSSFSRLYSVGGNISSSYSRLLKVRWAGKLSTTGTKLEPRLQRYVGNKTSGEVRRFHVDWQSNMCICSMCQKEHRGTCKERHDNKICKNSFYVFLKECCSIALVKNTGKGVIPMMVRVCKSFVL